MSLTLIIVIVAVVLLAGGGYGWRSGYYGGNAFGGLAGLVVLLAVLYFVFGGSSAVR